MQWWISSTQQQHFLPRGKIIQNNEKNMDKVTYFSIFKPSSTVLIAPLSVAHVVLSHHRLCLFQWTVFFSKSSWTQAFPSSSIAFKQLMCTRSCAQKNHRTPYNPKYSTFSLEKNCSGFQNLTKFSLHSFEADYSDWAFLDINIYFILSSKVQILGLLYSGFLFSLHCGWWCTGFPQPSVSTTFMVLLLLGSPL